MEKGKFDVSFLFFRLPTNDLCDQHTHIVFPFVLLYCMYYLYRYQYNYTIFGRTLHMQREKLIQKSGSPIPTLASGLTELIVAPSGGVIYTFLSRGEGNANL